MVGALELGELVDVGAHFARKLPFLAVAFHAHDDALAVDRIDYAGALAHNNGAGIASRHVLHAGADVRSFGAQQRNRLPLHVRSHERAVRVVIFKERNQAGGDRDQLLRTDVHVLDFAHVLQDEVAGLASVDQLGGNLALFVQADVGLRDDVLVFFPGREIIAVRLEFGGLLLGGFVGLIDLAAQQDLPDLQVGFARVQDPDFVHHVAVFDAAVGAFDEPVIVDPRKTRKRADQSDVRAFRRFNRTDAAVVRGMHVADFESGALAGQTAWSKSRETPLVRDLRQRIGLIHELR